MEAGVIGPPFWLGNTGPCDALAPSSQRPSPYFERTRRSAGEDRNASRVLPPFVTRPSASYTSDHSRLVSSFARSPRSS
jgi:hypothetical protein